jgi:HEAT repeat protein
MEKRERRKIRNIMESVPSNIIQAISDLADNEKTLLNSALADLSNLNAADLTHLNRIWPTIALERRRKIINRLVDLAEENFELNFDSILKSCLKDPDTEVRVKAIEGLWENEETILINIFIKMLKEDTSEEVQAAAAKALGKYAMLAELKKLGPYSSNHVSQALLAILNDHNKPREVWRRALEAAAPLSLPEVKRTIAEAYQSNDPNVINSAIYAMGKNCDSTWLPTLIKEMSNNNAITRYEAAGACGELCNDEAVPVLIKLTRDTDVNVQQAAISSLGKIGGIKAKQHLMKCLNSTDEVISEAAEIALKQIEAEEDSFIL